MLFLLSSILLFSKRKNKQQNEGKSNQVAAPQNNRYSYQQFIKKETTFHYLLDSVPDSVFHLRQKGNLLYLDDICSTRIVLGPEYNGLSLYEVFEISGDQTPKEILRALYVSFNINPVLVQMDMEGAFLGNMGLTISSFYSNPQEQEKKEKKTIAEYNYNKNTFKKMRNRNLHKFP